MNGSDIVRFWAKVNRLGPVPSYRPRLGRCWLWTASTTKSGYGKFFVGGRITVAHRALFEHERGPVDRGLDLDHLCRVRACVRPSHLERVTRRVNLLRGAGPAGEHAAQTHCIHGHPLSGANLYTYTDRDGYTHRYCFTCRHRVVKASDERRRKRAS